MKIIIAISHRVWHGFKMKKSNLTHLGQGKTEYPTQYDPKLLEAIPYQAVTEDDLWVSLICAEFTTLCPITNQPDFAKIFVNFIPAKKIVESKSLKLYLFSYRNHGGFHENCVKTICYDLYKILAPNFIEVIGEFTPRGGISIFPYLSMAKKEKRYSDLKKRRIENYRPGKYSCKLSSPY